MEEATSEDLQTPSSHATLDPAPSLHYKDVSGIRQHLNYFYLWKGVRGLDLPIPDHPA